MIRVIDYTLREGCQAHQCGFDNARSAQLAKEITALGVDMIECGHPRISAGERERIHAVVAAVSTLVLAHARARQEDIDAVLKTGAQWVELFASINAISLETKFKDMNREEVLELFHGAIRHARGRDLWVRATVEDVVRTSISDLVSMIATVRGAGADRICFADSVGILLSNEIFDVLSLLRHGLPDVVSEYRVHNNRGLTLGNTLAAIQAGVQWHSVSCNGIGERAGTIGTFQLLTLLHTKFAADCFNLRNVLAVSELVETYNRIKRSPMHPVADENAFVHVARLHRLAIQENQDAYNAFDPELINGRVSLQRYAPTHRQSLFFTPLEKSASELKYHRHGPGKRFVMLGRRLLDGSPFYFTARQFHDVDDDEPDHVDSHVHNCDSVFLFLGSDEDCRDLEVEVLLSSQLRRLQSPASVFIPAGVEHSYRYLGGSGIYISFVYKGDCHESLLEITQ